MDLAISKIINKLAIAICVVFILISLGLGYFPSLILLLAAAFAVRFVYGDSLKLAIEEGQISREDLVKMLFKSPFIWIAGAFVILVPVVKVMYS